MANAPEILVSGLLVTLLKFPPPSFNLASALHHACGGVTFVFEVPIGVKTEPYAKLTHEQILDLELLMYDELFKFAIERPVKWTR